MIELYAAHAEQKERSPGVAGTIQNASRWAGGHRRDAFQFAQLCRVKLFEDVTLSQEKGFLARRSRVWELFFSHLYILYQCITVLYYCITAVSKFIVSDLNDYSASDFYDLSAISKGLQEPAY